MRTTFSLRHLIGTYWALGTVLFLPIQTLSMERFTRTEPALSLLLALTLASAIRSRASGQATEFRVEYLTGLQSRARPAVSSTYFNRLPSTTNRNHHRRESRQHRTPVSFRPGCMCLFGQQIQIKGLRNPQGRKTIRGHQRSLRRP